VFRDAFLVSLIAVGGVASCMLRSFRELEVWQKAHGLVLEIYRLTDKFPDRERFGIVSQVRRSAASVPANIAEGFGRRTTKGLLQFLVMANGSLEETCYFLILSHDLGCLAVEKFKELDMGCTSVAQMIAAMARSLKERAARIRGSRVASHGPRDAELHG
jgi:four helix bundle protein